MNILRSLRIVLLLTLHASQVGMRSTRPPLLTQYAHSAWKPQDQGFAGTPLSIAQTNDGYIWIGTTAGLVRFDGVRFVTWSAPVGQSLSSPYVVSLLAARDGSLWIGTLSGLDRWNQGQLYHYAAESGSINFIYEGLNGSVWIGRGGLVSPDNRVCRVEDTHLRCFTSADGLQIPKSVCCVFSLLRDRKGSAWIAGDTALVRWNDSGSVVYNPSVLKTNQRQPGAFLGREAQR